MQLISLYEDLQHVHLVIEFMSGGCLENYLARQASLPEPLAKSIMLQALKALREIHELGIIHRDLKPENILITKYDPENIEIKIADFGLADIITPTKRTFTLKCGSPGYIAPEIL